MLYEAQNAINSKPPLDSPSKMVAASLASGNSSFRDRLREKLEASGGVACKIHVGGTQSKRAAAELAKAAAMEGEKGSGNGKRKASASDTPGSGSMGPPLFGTENGVKRWRKRELNSSVTNDDADNNYNQKGGAPSSKKSAMGPPEDTPR